MQRLLVGLFRFLHPFLSAAELSPPVRMLYRGALYIYIYMLYRVYIYPLPCIYICSTVYIYMLYRGALRTDQR